MIRIIASLVFALYLGPAAFAQEAPGGSPFVAPSTPVDGITIANTSGALSATGTLPVINLTAATGSYPSWTTASPVFNVPATTLNDSSGSGTIALRGAYTLNGCTFSASAAETITNGACLYIGAPIAGANTTLTGAVSLYTAGSTTAQGQSNAFSFSASSSALTPFDGFNAPSGNSLSFTTSGTVAGTVDLHQHWRIGGSGTPTIAANACGSTTQGTILAGGNDQSFQVTVGTAAVTTCTITFASAFTTAPRTADLTPANAVAAATGTAAAYISALSTTSVTITGTALAGAVYYIQVQ